MPSSDAMSGQLWPDAHTVMSSGDPDVRHFFPAAAARTLALPQRLALMPSKRERAFIFFK